MISSGTTPFLDYWAISRPILGESESGDQYVVAPYQDGVLVAVIDGLGHGEEAAASARYAAQLLGTHANESVGALMTLCHDGLRKCRGAVMSIASFNAAVGTMTWLGVGNVEGMLLGAANSARPKRASLVPRGGIVGDRLPPLNPVTVEVHPGDLLLFATDGIGSMFVRDLGHQEHPERLIHHIFVKHAKATDDALILGAQWTNGAGRARKPDDSSPHPVPDTPP